MEMVILLCGCIRYIEYGHTNTKLCDEHHAGYFMLPSPTSRGWPRPIAGKEALGKPQVDNSDLL